MIHSSGGGQTKCMKYLHSNFKIVKDNLFQPPAIFQLIQKASGADNREMFQVFNMGQRLEVFTTEKAADSMIKAATALGIQAQIIGHVESNTKKELVITHNGEEIIY